MENELLKANKHNHKVEITDEAINHVPRIEYKTIPAEHNDMLQELAKTVLRISKIENNSNEVAITYTLEREKLASQNEPFFGVAIGREHEANPLLDSVSAHIIMNNNNVSFIAKYDCVVILIHNHPNLSSISLEDINFFLKFERVRMIVVVTNLGAISYLVKTEKFDFNRAVLLFGHVLQRVSETSSIRDQLDCAAYFLHHCSKCGLIHDNR